MSLIWTTFGPWIFAVFLLLIIAFSSYGVLRLLRQRDWHSREHEVRLQPPHDRYRPQPLYRADESRQLPEERPDIQKHNDQVEADLRRLLGDDDEHTP